MKEGNEMREKRVRPLEVESERIKTGRLLVRQIDEEIHYRIGRCLDSCFPFGILFLAFYLSIIFLSVLK